MLLKDAENIDENALRPASDLRSARVKEISSSHRKLFPSSNPTLPMNLILKICTTRSDEELQREAVVKKGKIIETLRRKACLGDNDG